MEVKWSEHGAIWNTARGTHNMLWSDYHKWASTPKGFLVYLNDNLYHFIPKRVLSDTECADLQKTLEASGLKKR
jgi:hypothetical protein